MNGIARLLVLRLKACGIWAGLVRISIKSVVIMASGRLRPIRTAALIQKTYQYSPDLMPIFGTKS